MSDGKSATVTTNTVGGSLPVFLPRSAPCEALVQARSRSPVVIQAAVVPADLLRGHRLGGRKAVAAGSSGGAAKRGRRHRHLHHRVITRTKRVSSYCCSGSAGSAGWACLGRRFGVCPAVVGVWVSWKRISLRVLQRFVVFLSVSESGVGALRLDRPSLRGELLGTSRSNTGGAKNGQSKMQHTQRGGRQRAFGEVRYTGRLCIWFASW